MCRSASMPSSTATTVKSVHLQQRAIHRTQSGLVFDDQDAHRVDGKH